METYTKMNPVSASLERTGTCLLKFSESELQATKTMFDVQGYIGPFDLSHPEVVHRLSTILWKEEQRIKATRSIERWMEKSLKFFFKNDRLTANRRNFSTNRHLDIPEVCQILKDESLVFALNNLCAPNLLLWRTFLTRKGSGSRELGWHHDKHFQSGDQPLIDLNEISNHFSVLVAINDMTESNGVFRVIEGSHQQIAGFERDLRIKANKPLAAHLAYTLPDQLKSRVRKITLNKGQFLLFHSAILHGSEAYVAGTRRISLAMRFVTDSVEFPDLADPVELKRHQLMPI